MTNANAFHFGQFIPGFDFLKNLATAPAGSAAKGLGAWVAPTLNVEELERRVTELKAVLFWLEQNSTALKATIQALEVQKMTLATLQGMNVSMADLAKTFTVPASAPAATATPEAAGPAATGAWPYASAPASAPASAAPTTAPAAETGPTPEPAAPRPAASGPAGLADPMQWWGALTQQFQNIAANALRDVAAAAPPPPTAKRRRATAAKTTTATKAGTTSAKPATKRATASSGSRGRAAPARQKAAPPASSLGWPLPPPLKKRR